ncbi:MAG: flavodoxin domain-containing protein [Verrucomicrobiaceae bacterium]|nr:flavodoxin domain-containing protein [Verrucomicrobiaceae bacterium]
MVPLIPENAPFSAEQRAWLNGFLAGVLSRGSAPAGASLPAGGTQHQEPLLVLYGSQSGNAEAVAKKIAKRASAGGFSARAASMDTVAASALPAEKNVLVVTSTWGDGDMPDNAQSFWTSINQNGSSPKLKGVRYSVLALGDRNYADTFCLAGRKIDERFAELGAERVVGRADCDVDFEETAEHWSSSALAALGVAPAAKVTEESEEVGWTKKKPFAASLKANNRLTSKDSAKDTRHIVFSLKGSGMVYEVGDALGVYVSNCPEVVDLVINQQGLDAADTELREKLTTQYEIRHLLGKPRGEFSFETLRKLQPRLYSIASSLNAHPEEVHLTIGVVKYEDGGVQHKGVASTFLSERLALNETTGVFIHKANHFRLPTDTDVPIIMVGPGTGIAPFRAFLEEREATRSKGKNWLFFGDQRRASDFLYHEEITAWLQSGHLTRLDTAFSRDQENKVYVQDRMRQSADELKRWIDGGAYFYVCGDAKRMAKDVDAALREIVGESTVEAMRKEGRYCRDVY